MRITYQPVRSSAGLGGAGIRLTKPERGSRLLGESRVAGAYRIELPILEFLEIQESVVCAGGRPKQFIELDLYGLSVSVLRVLDEKDHEKRHYGCPGIDHELSSVTETKERASDEPCQDDAHSQDEGPGLAAGARRCFRETGERGGVGSRSVARCPTPACRGDAVGPGGNMGLAMRHPLSVEGAVFGTRSKR